MIEETEKTPGTENRKHKIIWTVVTVLLFAVMAAAWMLTLSLKDKAYENRMNEAMRHTVSLTDYYGNVTEVTYSEGETPVLPEPAPVSGMRFLGWQNSDGTVTGRNTVFSGDCSLTASYAVSLESDSVHNAYLLPNENGFYMPDGIFTMSDFAIAVDALVQVKPKVLRRFSDVDRTMPCYSAAMTLRALKLIDSNLLRPDEPVTAADIIYYLSRLYPQPENDYDFKTVGPGDYNYQSLCTAVERRWISLADADRMTLYRPVSRLTAARLINRIINRSTDTDPGESMTGCVIELRQSSAGYADFVEAIVPHTCSKDSGGEKWLSSEPVAPHEPGLMLVDFVLYCVDDTGHLVRDAVQDGLQFDADGKYTSGDPNLDEVVLAKLRELLEPGMEMEDMLKVLYRYCREDFSYLRRDYITPGETDWWREPAYIILTTGKGNCYCYNAAFCALGRALGNNFNVMSGTVTRTNARHGWCTLEKDGVTYVYDPELQFRRNDVGGDYIYFGIGPYLQNKFRYYYPKPKT